MRDARSGANRGEWEKFRDQEETQRRASNRTTMDGQETKMLVLIMTVCSLNSPDSCREARMQFSADESPMQCMMRAQPYIAQWAEQHPGRQVTRWRCVYPEREGQPT
jgi:hypothetical protein